jgi:phytoene dehydrogenase-like protein
MPKNSLVRRDFLKAVLAGIPALSLDWEAFPRGDRPAGRAGRSVRAAAGEPWDAVIIGAGLGGLSCAAGFARQGFRPLVLEQHSIPGGYATTFKRPGGFVFDASLHSTSVGERNGVFNLIQGFPEITDIEFVPHKGLYRAVFPDHDIRVPHKDPDAYVGLLTDLFPEEKAGIQSLFQTMRGLLSDLGRYQGAGGKVDMANFPREFPYLVKCFNSTWGTIQDAHIKDHKLKGVVSALWGYFGLPPSKLASIYYILPVMGYLESGGYYPVGRSQKISDALRRFIEERGGKVLLRTRAERILVKDHAAYGVKTAEGSEHLARVVVSNANAYDTVHKMMDEAEYLKSYLARMDTFTTSLSSFQVFLGLKKDLVGETGIKDTEIFYETSYDAEEGYRQALNAEVEKGGYGLTSTTTSQGIFAGREEYAQHHHPPGIRPLEEVRGGLFRREKGRLPGREGATGRHPDQEGRGDAPPRSQPGHRGEGGGHTLDQRPLHEQLPGRDLRLGPDRRK